MYHSTTDVYQAKREILHFLSTLTKTAGKVQQKFVADLLYGIFSSKSVILRRIAAALQEPIQIQDTLDRLSQHLQKPLSDCIRKTYLQEASQALGEEPLVIFDDSDIIKPYGKEFEALGKVPDGSKKGRPLEKGYYLTQAVGLGWQTKEPIPLFSQIHSSLDRAFVSSNDILFKGIDQIIEALQRRSLFVFDRGYDQNTLMQYLEKRGQDYLIRIKQNRKLFYRNKWYPSTTLRDGRKGKIKTELCFQEKGQEVRHTVYISHLPVQITAKKQRVSVIFVYDLGEVPMMLVTNKPIKGKADVIQMVRTYMKRWKIEEYFRFKKDYFDLEDIRVRSLQSLNQLHAILDYGMFLVGRLASQRHKRQLTDRFIANACALRTNIRFWYYQIAQGLRATLGYAKEGIRSWFKRRRRRDRQQTLFDFL